VRIVALTAMNWITAHAALAVQSELPWDTHDVLIPKLTSGAWATRSLIG
jgi:hypothetical protein